MILSFDKENCEKRNFPEKILKRIKITTIREDIHCRWKEGRAIQFYAINPRNGGKKFAEGICTKVDTVSINFILNIVCIYSNEQKLDDGWHLKNDK